MESRKQRLPSLQEVAIRVDNVWLGELGLYEVDDVREIPLSSVRPVIDSLWRGIRGDGVSKLWRHWARAVVVEDK